MDVKHMAISFDAALGIHESALKLRGQRAQILANNLATADTPNFKARDVDFTQRPPRASRKGSTFTRRAPHGRHRTPVAHGGSDTLYRVPRQPAIDGNTVEEQVE